MACDSSVPRFTSSKSSVIANFINLINYPVDHCNQSKTLLLLGEMCLGWGSVFPSVEAGLLSM